MAASVAGSAGWGKDLPGRGAEGGRANAHSHPEHKQAPHGSVQPRGQGPAQGQLQRSEERAGAGSVFMNGQGGKTNSTSHLSLSGRAAGATDPMGGQGGGTGPRPPGKALPRPPPPPALLPSWAVRAAEALTYNSRFLSSMSDFCLFWLGGLFLESCSPELVRFLTLGLPVPWIGGSWGS